MLRQTKTFLITTVAELAELYQSKQVWYHSTRWNKRSDAVLKLAEAWLTKQHPRKLLFQCWVAQISRGPQSEFQRTVISMLQRVAPSLLFRRNKYCLSSSLHRILVHILVLAPFP
ncbi:hypothetical protein EJ110_NYTH37340 [Nymphaea thermarum]|nr:hypothetical protein EJ110_NYTH37340 [Nymphaea thermarum]